MACLLLVGCRSDRAEVVPPDDGPIEPEPAGAPLDAGNALPPGESTQPELPWVQMLERDRRIAFTSRSAPTALKEIGQPFLTTEARAIALFTLGAAGQRRERARLESWANEGELIERQAAILALGECGLGNSAVLPAIARSADPEVAPYALLAMLRSEDRQARALVERAAGAGSSFTAQTSRALLQFVDAPQNSSQSEAALRLLELRWDAARDYGLVDGRTWNELQLDRLEQDQEFLDRLVYGGAAELKSSKSLRDHFLGVVTSGGPARRLRSAVQAIPFELDSMVEHQLWAPANAEEWAVVLDEIDVHQLESLTQTILNTARTVPDLAAYASLLLVRGGNPAGVPLLELDLSSPVALERRRIAEVMGGTDELRFVGVLEPLLEDPDPDVQASAWVASYRLGGTLARTRLPERARDPASPDFEVLVRALLRALEDPNVSNLAEEAYPFLEGDLQLEAAVAFAERGWEVGRDVLREALLTREVSGDEGARWVRALAKEPAFEDIEILRRLFPAEDDLELNVALALTLLSIRDLEPMPLLRTALWLEPWNRSVLSARLIIEIGGIVSLRNELTSPPRNATQEGLFRIGWALGEFGGHEEVERLARRTSSANRALMGAYLGAMAARTH